MGRRTWFKIYAEQWLKGSIAEEPLAIRGLWASLLALAANSEYGDIGKIQVMDSVGFTDEQIAKLLKVPKDEWMQGKKRLIETERITVHNDTNVIAILNWSKYQSEYHRQKPHRSEEFKRIREEIRKRDNYTCQECGKTADELKVPLCIHHIDGNPENFDSDNLITLCMTCRSHVLKEKAKSSTKKFNKKVQARVQLEKGEGRI